MKIFLNCLVTASLLISISACSFSVHTGTAHTRNINESVIKETRGVADLAVNEQKVSGTSTGYKISDESAKNMAVYDALKKANADVLIEPNYDIDHTGNTTTVTVSGFPGFYKNFRKPTGRDSLILGLYAIVPPVQAVNYTGGNAIVTVTTSNVNMQQASPVNSSSSTDAQNRKK